MSYRKRTSGSKKFNVMVATKLRKIEEGESPDYPMPLPDLRRKIIIESYELLDPIKHEILLYTTDRIDCYKMIVDDVVVDERIGWAKVLDKIRKAFVRLKGL